MLRSGHSEGAAIRAANAVVKRRQGRRGEAMAKGRKKHSKKRGKKRL
jgi:hypothetical protein